MEIQISIGCADICEGKVGGWCLVGDCPCFNEGFEPDEEEEKE